MRVLQGEVLRLEREREKGNGGEPVREFAGISEKLLAKAVPQMAAGITLLDSETRVVYYNAHAAAILDRKPDYIGRPVNDFHNQKSKDKIDALFEEFRRGRTEPAGWQLNRGDDYFVVRVAPIRDDKEFLGVVHTVIRLNPEERP